MTRKASAPDIQLEKAAVLFNVGASYAASGAACDRSAPEGQKAACAAFQAAAGAFDAMREVVGKLASPATPDLSVEAAGALCAACCAQAQECMYDTAVATDKSGALCGKLARGAQTFWEAAASALATPPLRDAVERAFGAACALRGALAGARAAGHAAAEAAKADDKATEAARLAGALFLLRRELKAAKTALPAAALVAGSNLETALAQRFARAERDAEAVYMVRVPPHESLPPLPGMPAVKPTPLAPLLDASKEQARAEDGLRVFCCLSAADGMSACALVAQSQLLRTVVPDAAAKAISRYSEAVDGVIRDAAARLGDASDAARLRLRELELPDLLDALAGGALPAPLLSDLADVARAGGLGAIAAQLPRLSDAARACAAALAAAAASLDADAAADAAGGGAGGAGAAAHTAGLRAKLAGYESSLAAAARSDTALAARTAAAEPQIALLSPAGAAAGAPRLQLPLVPFAADAETAGALRATLSELEKNAAERAGLVRACSTRARCNVHPRISPLEHQHTNARTDASYPMRRLVCPLPGGHAEGYEARRRRAAAPDGGFVRSGGFSVQ
jgi:programmed cell death 6-interacting protein